MKILVISQYFYPENFRINQLCLELKNMGHEVEILTGKPNYPEGEYFDGYSYKGKEDEIWNDIVIHRVPLRARKKGAIALFRNYVSFVFHARRKVNDLLDRHYDLLYVFEVSPITVALPAIKFKKKTGVPIIINIQDLWPENIVAVTGINNKIVIRAIDVLVNYIYKHCDFILCASPSFVTKIQARVKNINKVKYWPQYSTISAAKESKQIFDKRYFNIVFTGNIGEAQGLEIAIEAARQLKEKNIRWHFIGNGRNREKLELMVKDYQLQEQVLFYGFKPEKEIPNYLSNADAALLILKPNPVFEMTIPAKLQTYMACGVPIIGCVSGEGKRIIKEAQVGLVSEDISVQALIDVCNHFLELDSKNIIKFKNNALKYNERFFSKEKLLMELNNYMEELI